MPDTDRRLNPSLLPALLFAILLLLPFLSSCSSTPAPDEFKGTVFSDEREAQDFRLTDQFGRTKSLRQDFAGRIVVLTFLYTACPDVCPIVANHLRDISTLLGDDSSQVAIVIISVDPEGDTVESVFDYSERWQMTNRWTYLTGERSLAERRVEGVLHRPLYSRSRQSRNPGHGCGIVQGGERGC